MASCIGGDFTAAKAYYFVVFGLTVVVTWILRDYAEGALKNVPQIKTCFTAQVGDLFPSLPLLVCRVCMECGTA